MDNFKTLKEIGDVGDVENNFIVKLANGVNGFVDRIDAKINSIKFSHLENINNLQNSKLVHDLSKEDYTNNGFNNNVKSSVYKVPKSINFYDTNDFYSNSIKELYSKVGFIEDSILIIKRFRTKEAYRMSVKGPDLVISEIEYDLKLVNEKKVKVFDSKQTAEYAELGKYFGNAKTIHRCIDNMYDVDSVINDVEIHKLKVSMDRLSVELKKLITTLDSTTAIISKAAMENIMYRVSVSADYITAISNLYYIHIESVASLKDLKEKIKG